jgi:hypothetical protein
MKLEKQVVSLELAKRLKELGVKQESIFWWREFTEMATSTGVQKANYWALQDGAHRRGAISAFTVAELGEMLPHTVQKDDCDWLLHLAAPFHSKWIIYYQVDEGTDKIRDGKNWIMADTEAGARAKMLIYLIENKLIGL